ncbi:hypothetical protein [Nocardia spumae]|uniref:hypothetical protein n=1 Tax=Nocardia spumae TaxID=2887190 RepID=UPI001D15E19F|nr:hypothetical protein [Nocardia spumae]
MANKQVTVTVTVDDIEWAQLCDVAECAGMSVRDYLATSVREVALQSRPPRSLRSHPMNRRPRRSAADDDSETAAWTESFSDRLRHRAEAFPEV